MIINQVGGNKPVASDNELISWSPLYVVFKEYNDKNGITRYTGAFSGERIDKAGTAALMGDTHLYQSFKKMDISTTEKGYGPSETVSLTTHIASPTKSHPEIFNESSVGAKKGSGIMFIYLYCSNSTTYKPDKYKYGIFTKFTFDFTDGKDVIIPEITSVGGNDIRTLSNGSGDYSRIFGYILNATFE